MESLSYISPVPGSKYIMPGNNIAIRHGEPFQPESFKSDILYVSNSRGERHPGNIVLSDDNKTLIYKPLKPFKEGDEIYVELNRGLFTTNGIEIEPVSFHFFITEKIIEIDQAYVDKYIREVNLNLEKPGNQIPSASITVKDNSLPEGYAANTVLVDNNPPEGYYFFAPYDEWGWYPDTKPFITITDRLGTPVYYRKLETYGYDLKIQPTGVLSFYSYTPFWQHQAMDSDFQIINTYKMGNGYSYTDFHDFQLKENGHYFVMTYDAQLVDMSLIVPGGNPEAIVSGFVMQELDSNDNVILQWRSWDHFEITETGSEIDLTDDHIDYVHGNTIEVESDTSILLSSRNFHEVTKIHRNSGEIIWRLGGSQNQFELLGDEGDILDFSRQHDSRRLSNGQISIFDNGTKRPGQKFSSVPVYEVDVENSTATLMERYQHNPDLYGMVMGNAQWTPNSTIVVGWGSCVPGITEIDLNGEVLYELHFDGVSYRAYRYPWETTYFDIDVDSVNYGYIWKEDQRTKTIKIHNKQDHEIEITGYHLHSEKFTVDDDFPINIPAGAKKNLHITFEPGSFVGTFSDVLTLNSDINTEDLVQRIAQQVLLEGSSTEGQGIGDENSLKVVASPNPVKNVLKLTLSDHNENLQVRVLDYTGKILKNEWHYGGDQYLLDMQSFTRGLYFIELRDTNQKLLNVLKIVKE